MPRPRSRPVILARVAGVVVILAVLAAVVIGTHPFHPAPRRAASAATTPGPVQAPAPPAATTTIPSRPLTAPPGPAITAATGAGALAGQIDPILVNTDSCVIVRDAGGHALYAHQPSNTLAPASTQKLLVAAAALDVLGPDYRFTTTVVGARRAVGGQISDVWLVGSGDPVLDSPEYTSFLALQPITGGRPVTTPLVSLATQLAAAGVRSIPGGIHGDDSLFDRTRFLPTWPVTDLQEGDVAPLGALEVDDGLDRWHPAVLTADPAAHAAGVLARLAGTAGIATSQGADGVPPPGAVVLASIESPTVADLVTSMLRVSDNTAAEMLVRVLDHVTGGAGTTAGGLGVVQREMAKLGVPAAGLSLVDGSGLSPQDRVSCETLLDALDLSSQSRFGALALLSVAGRFGTLYNRFAGTPAVDHLAAKTGNIQGVFGLVGRLDEGAPLSFAFLLNGPLPYTAGVAYEDRLVAALGTYRP